MNKATLPAPAASAARRASSAPPPDAPAGVPPRQLRWRAFGVQCEIHYVCADVDRARALEAEIVPWVAEFEAKYSSARPDSVIARINAAAGEKWTEIDEETEKFLDLSATLHQLTESVLDVTTFPLTRLWAQPAERPRLPSDAEIAAARKLVGLEKIQRAPGRVRLPERGMAIDFGGWAREYAVDRVADGLKRNDIAAALIAFGHDHYAIGAAPASSAARPGWPVGLEDPSRPADETWSRVAARDCGVASSGDYLRGFTLNGKRYGPVIDPRTGRPVANGCRQVTVIARSCLQAGALATAVFILGPEAGLPLVEDFPGAEACVLAGDARRRTTGFSNHEITH